MQEKELTGDALLAHDADYVRGSEPRVYYAFPSKQLPRFLVPDDDRVGLLFTFAQIASHRTVLAWVLPYARVIPGGLVLLRALFFERTRI